MTAYENLQTVVDQIVDAAIESTMDWYGFHGDVRTGFTDKRYTVTPPGPGGGMVTDHLAEKTTDVLDDSSGGHVNVRVDVYEAWDAALNEAFHDWLRLPDPGHLDGAVAAMKRVATALPHSVALENGGVSLGDSGIGLAVDNADSEIAQFNGDTIQTFDDGYLTPLKLRVLPGHHAVARVLGTWVLAEQKIWDAARHDVTTIATQVLEAMKQARPAHGGGAGLAALLGVVEAASNALSVFLPVAGDVNTVAGVLKGFLPEKSPGKEKEPPFGGANPAVVHEHLLAGLRELNQSIYEQEDDMWSKLTRARDTVLGARGHFDLAAPTGLVEETDVLQIIKSTTTGDLDIQQDLTTLTKIGHQYMGTIATVLTSAAADCEEAYGAGSWARPAGIGLGTYGAYAPWHELADLLRYLMENTSQEVRAAGDHLAIAASYMARTDEDVDAALRRMTARLKAHGAEVEHLPPVAPPSAGQPGRVGGRSYAI